MKVLKVLLILGATIGVIVSTYSYFNVENQYIQISLQVSLLLIVFLSLIVILMIQKKYNVLE
ncbi:hypothetical protein C8K15_13011 [Paenisporosarcina sp. OV554]|nr:hypothetical protein C8K15_13011 [Paenisporosarcina sp. OV554]